MLILKIISILLFFFTTQISAKEYTGETVEEYINNKIEVINTKTRDFIEHDLIQLREPAASLACDKTNGNKITIIRDIDGYLFFLSVNELLAIKVNSKNVAELFMIGTLLDIEENDPIVDIQMEKWMNFYMIIIQQSTKLKIYLVRFDISNSPDISHIQKIEINSMNDKFKVFRRDNDVVMVIYHINENLANEMIFYTWQTSYFSKDVTEEVDLPNKSNLFIFNENSDETLILSIGYGVGNQSTQVYALCYEINSNRWKKLQKMRFKKDYIEHFSIHGKLYLVGCSSDSYCAIYKWNGRNFRRHLKISSGVFEIIKSIYSHHNLIIIENFQNKLSLYTTSDIIGVQPGITITKSNDITDHGVYKSSEGFLYFMEVARNESSIRASFYEISIIDGSVDDGKPDSKEIDPIECVKQLKASMKNRVASTMSTERNAKLLISNPGQLDMRTKRFVKAKYVNLKDATVGSLKMPFNISVLKSDLYNGIRSSNIQIEEISRALNNDTWESRERADGNFEGDFASINVHNLIYNGNQPLFKDIVKKSQSVITLNDQIRFNNLTANKISIKENKINLMPLNKLLNATTTKSVKGTKNIQMLQINDAKVSETINNIPLTFLNATEAKLKQSRRIDFNGDINVENLNVKILNGFDVPKLMNDLYLKSSQTVIKGDLFVRSFLNVENLHANHLKLIPINNFMTTSTDQVIESDVLITKFHATTIMASTVNGDETSNFALINENSTKIEIPTRFFYLNVKNNLNIEDVDGESRGIRNFINLVQQRVIGTDLSDLAQYYNGKVVIRGSLAMSDVAALTNRTKITVGDFEIPQNISENYWSKSKNQMVHVGDFQVHNSVSANGIVTKLLNNHPVSSYLRIDTADYQGTVNYLRFENAVIKGDVIGDKNNYPSSLLQLSQNVIRIDGPPAIVATPVEFRNKLVINNLYTKSVNGNPAGSLIHKHNLLVIIEAPKIIENLTISHNFVVDSSLSIVNYNNVNLQKFLNEIIRIDQPTIRLNKLSIKSFNAFNLTVDDFEQHNLNSMISNLQSELDVIASESLQGKRSIRIHGDATFTANIFIDSLNGAIDFNEFVNLLALNVDEKNQLIGGRKTFQKGLTVTEHLNCKAFDGFSVNRLVYQSLSRGDKQTISGEFYVKNLRVKELYTRMLNEIAWNQLIDRTKLKLPLRVNFDVEEMEVEDLYTEKTTLDFGEMLRIMQYPQRSNWNRIVNNKNDCELIYGNNTYLGKLMSDGVLKSVDQAIKAKVTFMNSFYMGNVNKKNDEIATRTTVINIKALNKDSVKNNSPNEVIRGRKTITNGYRFDANNLIIGKKCNFYTAYINNINIMELYKSLYKPGDILIGKKYFNNLEVNELHIHNGLLNGIQIDDIYTIKEDSRLPAMRFDFLEVDNLVKLFTFNNYSLLNFLEYRMRKTGHNLLQLLPGHITIKSMELDAPNNAIISINNVNLDDAVYLTHHENQYIEGRKVIDGSLFVNGKLFIDKVNDVDFATFMKSVITKDSDFATNTPIQLSEQVVLKSGMHIHKSINDRNIDELLSSNAHSPKLNDLMTLIGNVTTQILEIDHQKAIRRKKKRMLYIDVDENIEYQYKTPRSNDDSDECTKRKEIDFKPFSKGVLITQKSELEMTVELPSVKFKLIPNFKCDDNSVSEIELWWNYHVEADVKYFRNFTFKNKLVDVKFMESTDSRYVLMVVLLQNKETADIQVLRLDKSAQDIVGHQTITGYYETTKIALVDSTYLVASTFNENSSDQDTILIYRFDLKAGQFLLSQKPIPGENFDIILSMNVKSLMSIKGKIFLLFAKSDGKYLKIFQRRDDTGEFVFQRMIDDFKDKIVEVLVLYIGEKPFIVVSQKSGLFCLYEWRGIESWKSKYCGRFENIRQMKSYEYLNRQHLFLASIADNTSPSINALAIYRQGD